MNIEMHKKALLTFLGNDCNSLDIENAGTFENKEKKISSFKFNNSFFYVAEEKTGLSTNDLVKLENEIFEIKKIDLNSPYERFKDNILIDHFNLISTNDFEIISINQKKQMILLRSTSKKLVAFKYSSHIPENISSYYLIGATESTLSEINEIFTEFKKQ